MYTNIALFSQGEVMTFMDIVNYFAGKPKRMVKMGKRADLGLFVRSSWEANYARYLNWLVEHKQIHRWEYEPDTFWFEGIKRGCVSYLPDFKIWEKKDSIPYFVEVKGYMDQRSQTKLKRMKKYYPHVKIILIQRGEYAKLCKQFKGLISNWE